MREIERVPEGVTIIPSRASNFDRGRITEHIVLMCRDGRLTPEEAAARIQLANTSQSWPELRLLIQDLPPLPVRSSYWRNRDWDKPRYWAPAVITGLILSVQMIVIPSVLLSAAHGTGTAIILVPLLVIGCCGTLASLVWGGVKLEDM